LKINEENGVITMVDPADSLVKAYSSILRSESSLKEAFKENAIETRYLRELINIKENIDGNMITVSVTYKDGEGTQKILDNILEGVNARQSELKSSLGPHSVILMNGETSMVADQELADSQNERVNSLSEIQTRLEEAQRSLDELEEPQAPTGLSFKGVLKSAVKYGVLGAILGGFMTAFVWCVIYVINPRLHSAEEFKTVLG
jgi:Zn-dependent metalloprotease